MSAIPAMCVFLSVSSRPPIHLPIKSASSYSTCAIVSVIDGTAKKFSPNLWGQMLTAVMLVSLIASQDSNKKVVVQGDLVPLEYVKNVLMAGLGQATALTGAGVKLATGAAGMGLSAGVATAEMGAGLAKKASGRLYKRLKASYIV